MSLLNLQKLQDVEEETGEIKAVGVFNGVKIHDLSTVDPVTLEQIFILVQLRSGVLFQGNFNDREQLLWYIYEQLDESALDIPIGGKLKVSSFQTECAENQKRTNKIKEDINNCLKNDNNNSSCLVQLSEMVHKVENQLLTCKPGERQRLTDLLDTNLLKYLQQKKVQQKCETELCAKLMERNKEMLAFANLQAQATKQKKVVVE